LRREYRRTERRARALENILLPEIEAVLQVIEDHLEALDREEAVRVRHVHRATAGPHATASGGRPVGRRTVVPSAE
jgi:V/A-type H+-transporting ATPase subunit D